jgi:hypothetical protein
MLAKMLSLFAAVALMTPVALMHLQAASQMVA